MSSSAPFTPSALNDLIAQRLKDIAAQVGREKGTIAVKGSLRAIPEPWRNDVIYADLVDPVSPTNNVPLQVRSSTMREAEIEAGDTVIAYGSIVANFYKGQLKLRLRADRVELAEPPDERERRSAELPLLEAVRRAGGEHRSFPRVLSPTVALLCAEGSAVKLDFLGALGPQRAELRIGEVVVSMASPERLWSSLGVVAKTPTSLCLRRARS